MRDVAVISFASVPTPEAAETEVQLLFPVVNEAIEMSGIERRKISFTCSASCDYLAGAPFSFVSNLEATGAWPPIEESHVEQDGAWALYEAWVRLQHGDIDTALAFSSGLTSRGDLREVTAVQLDPYYLTPLFPDSVSIAALQARALLETGRYTEADLASVAARSRVAGARNPDALLRQQATTPVIYAEIPGAQHAFELFPSLRTTFVIHGVERFLAYVYSQYLVGQRGAAQPSKLAAAS